MTFDVSILDKSNDFNKKQLLNNSNMSITLPVSKLVISNEVKDWQSLKMELIFVICIVTKLFEEGGD
jgi:hypothetical protein